MPSTTRFLGYAAAATFALLPSVTATFDLGDLTSGGINIPGLPDLNLPGWGDGGGGSIPSITCPKFCQLELLNNLCQCIEGYTPSYDHLGNLLECLCPEFSLPPNNYCEPDDDNNHSGEGKCNSCKSGWCSNWACTPGGSQACYGDDCKSGGHYCGDGDKDGQWWDDLTHSWQFSISFNKRDYQRQLQLASRCPANTQACPLFGGRGFECLDTKNDIESCGGCRYSRKNPGADCTAIENSEGVSCINSQCVVETCSPGFAPSEDGKGCIIDPLRKRNKNVYEMDLLLE